MSDARIAVLVRTYFWDDFAFRACLRIWSRCEGLDFYILADETRSGALDTGPFRKLGHTTADFQAAGLPCSAPDNFAPLWWNCDYSLYDAALKLPEYDYYYVIESDVAISLDLRPMIEQVIAAGHDCLLPFGLRPMDPSWAWSTSCRSLPYAKRAWVPISLMFASRHLALHLLSERQKLASKFADGAPADWAFCEGFVGSALLDAGFNVGSAHRFADSIAFWIKLDLLGDRSANQDRWPHMPLGYSIRTGTGRSSLNAGSHHCGDATIRRNSALRARHWSELAATAIVTGASPPRLEIWPSTVRRVKAPFHDGL